MPLPKVTSCARQVYFQVVFSKGFPFYAQLKTTKVESIVLQTRYLCEYSIFFSSVFFLDSYRRMVHFIQKILSVTLSLGEFEQKNRPLGPKAISSHFAKISISEKTKMEVSLNFFHNILACCSFV